MNKFHALLIRITQKLSTQFTWYILISLSSILCLKSYAVTLQDLLEENNLTIETKVLKKPQQIVNQPITISIEIATNRWFAKGTRIERFELANTVRLSNSETSINGTKNVKGQTWSTQTREIVIYPRRAGIYELPAISVQTSINTEKDGIVEGVIKTQPQTFSISTPLELTNLTHVIVSPNVDLSVLTENNNQDNEYSIGSAITKNITITADNTPAMMIPAIELAQQTGLSIYHKTPQVFDKSNRGVFKGTRIESFTFIMKKSGKYIIPKQIIYWWNTDKSELKEIIIPSFTMNVGEAVNNQFTADVPILLHMNLKQIVWLVILTLVISSILFFTYRFQNNLIRLFANITRLKKRTIKKAFLKAISNQNYISALGYLEQYSQLIDLKLEQVESEQLLSLNKLAFSNNKQPIIFTLQQAKGLLKELNRNNPTIVNKITQSKILNLNNE